MLSRVLAVLGLLVVAALAYIYVAGLGLGFLIFVRGEALALSCLSRAVAPRTLADLSAQIGPATHVVVP